MEVEELVNLVIDNIEKFEIHRSLDLFSGKNVLYYIAEGNVNGIRIMVDMDYREDFPPLHIHYAKLEANQYIRGDNPPICSRDIPNKLRKRMISKIKRQYRENVKKHELESQKSRIEKLKLFNRDKFFEGQDKQ